MTDARLAAIRRFVATNPVNATIMRELVEYIGAMQDALDDAYPHKDRPDDALVHDTWEEHRGER